MAVRHAQSGEVIDIRPLGAGLATAKTTTLVKAETVEIVRLMIPAGKEIADHQAPGEITVQCLEGRIEFGVEGSSRELAAGQMLYLASGVRHRLRGLEDSSLLLTLVVCD
jgi:quercetin dioxygenase-like cupin family protein